MEILLLTREKPPYFEYSLPCFVLLLKIQDVDKELCELCFVFVVFVQLGIYLFIFLSIYLFQHSITLLYALQLGQDLTRGIFFNQKSKKCQGK